MPSGTCFVAAPTGEIRDRPGAHCLCSHALSKGSAAGSRGTAAERGRHRTVRLGRYRREPKKIGDVTDLVLSSNGNITTAVIGVGGFLGVGQKDVAVPFKDLKISLRNGRQWLALNRTKEDLQSAAAYEPSGRSVATSASSLSTANWLASDIYKADVYDNSENKIGNITDLVLDSDGKVTTAVIGVGGVLGAGQKDVAVPFKDLKISSRDGKDWLVLDRTKDALKNAPAYDKKSEIKKM